MKANLAPRAGGMLTILALVCLATWAAWFQLEAPAAGIDDANIFFVYAHNVAAGNGFVFNPGGERVEGFTSLAWVLVCAAGFWSAASPERVLLLINVLLLTATIGCCLTTATFRRSPNTGALSFLWVSVFLALLLSDYTFVTWNTITLMDTALWTALLTVAAHVVLSDAVDRMHVYGLASVVALMVVTRPEALVWGPVMVLLFYVTRTRAVGNYSALRSTLPAAVAYALTAGLLTVFRLWYFRYPLPNTYYAKISPSLAYRFSEGTDYLWAYLSSGPVPIACTVALVCSVFHLAKVRLHDTHTVALSVMATAGLLLPVYMGGDHFDGFRFYQPVHPILLLVFVNGLRFLVPRYFVPELGRYARHAFVITGIGLALYLLMARVTDWRNIDRRAALRREFDIAELGRERGRHAERLFSGLAWRPSIGTITVGGLKYAYSGDVIDLMGLNNTRMAHNDGSRVGIRSHAAFEKRTFYELNPTLVLPLVQFSDLAVQETRIWFVDVALKGLVNDAPFRQKYRLAEVRKSTPDGVVAVAGWYDRDFLRHLARSKTFHIAESDTLPE